jgi:hypothetical protein
VNGEKKRAPLQRRKQKDEPDDREFPALDEIDKAGGEMRPIN